MNRITLYDTDAAARRIERERQLIAQGIDPFLRAVTGQDFAPPAGGERKFEISIKDLSTAQPPPPGVTPSQPPKQEPRWTQPSEPPSSPASFAADYVAAVAVRLGHRLYKRQSLPKEENESDPDTFAGRVNIAIKRRRKGYAPPKPWSKPAVS